MEGTLLDGVTVSARALGWDARDNDGTEWALFHSDLPALSRVVGTLTVNWVDDPGYTQFVVNGIPVDPASIVQEDHTDLTVSVLTAAGTHEGAVKAWQVRDHGVPGQMSKADFKKYLATAQPGQTPHAPLGPGQKAALTKKFKAIDAQVAADKAEWEATMAAMAAHNAEVEAAQLAAEAASAQAAVDQYEYQQKLAAEEDAKAIELLGGQPAVDAILDKQLETLSTDPLAQVETTPSGKVQLTKEAFAKYLETASADSIPPGPLGAGQKAAVTKKLKNDAMLADIAELDALDVAADKKALSDAAYATAQEAKATAAAATAPAPVGDVNDWYYGPGEDDPGSVDAAEAAAAVAWLEKAPKLSAYALEHMTETAEAKIEAKSGPLGTMEFQAWLQNIDPSSVITPPSEMLPWQKAALTKKLKSVSPAVPEFLPGPVTVPPGPKLQTPKLDAEAAAPKPQSKQQIANAVIAGMANKPAQAPPLQKTLDNVTQISTLNAYIQAATGHPPTPGSPDAVLKQAKQVAAQHAFDMQLLGQVGYSPAIQMTARDARRAVLRETGQRKPTGGTGQGPTVHTTYGAGVIGDMNREKLEAVVMHHSGGVTTKAALKNISVTELKHMAIDADMKYGEMVATLTKMGKSPASIPHSLFGARQVYLGKSKGLVGDYLAAPTTAAKKVTKAAQAKLDAQAKKAAKKAASDAKKTPAQLATKPAGWASMTAGEKWSWSHAYNLQAKGIYPKTATTPGGSHALGQHIVKPYPTEQKAVSANSHAVDALATGNHFSSSNHDTRNHNFIKATTSAQQSAWQSYTASGYTQMNGCLKRGTGCTDEVKHKNLMLDDAIRLHGSPAPKVLFRGKHRGTAKDLARKVGSEYEDPGFGSWSGTLGTPRSFANTGSTGVKHSIMYRLVDSKGIRAAPSTSGENESILPPKTRFRVLAITDFTSGEYTHRILDVEVIHKPYG